MLKIYNLFKCKNNVLSFMLSQKCHFLPLRKIMWVLIVGLTYNLVTSLNAYSNHGVPLVNISQSISQTTVVVNGQSDSPTCGGGPYQMELELVPSSATFTGNPNYASATMAKPNCIVQSYPSITINFNNLSAETAYKWRVREKVLTPGFINEGPWSAVFTFTVPKPKVLLLAADNSTFANDVKNKLINTGAFSGISIFELQTSTPTLSYLKEFNAVLLWTNTFPQNATAAGDVLAQYIEAGGGVVSSIFNQTETWGVKGAFNTSNYLIINSGHPYSNPSTLGIVHNSSHPIMQNVNSFDGGASSYRSLSNSLTPNSQRIADWADGNPLVAVKENLGLNQARRADLNFFPPSSDVRGDFWVATTDGTTLMKNALRWVANVTLLPTIATSPISGSWCAGANLNISFTTSGTFNSGNIFTAQLSDAAGSFSSPTNIGTLLGTGAGLISGTLPGNIPAGNGYRIRVISSNPQVIGTDNGSNLTFNSLPVITFSSSDPDNIICAGESVTFTAGGGTKYEFFVGGISQGESTLNTFTTKALTNGQAVSVKVSNANNCSVTSAEIITTVNALPTATITASGATTICQGSSVTLNASIGASYKWFKNNVLITDASGASFSATEPGSYTVEVTNSNNCSVVSEETVVNVETLQVANIRASDASTAPATTVPLGTTTAPATTTYTISNTNATSYTWSVTYSENTTEPSITTKGGIINLSNNNKTITITWPTDMPRVYKLKVIYQNSCVNSANLFVAVYDPTAGFVTGGGSIYSPPTALLKSPTGVENPQTIAGIANFGFVSRYKKGLTVEGNTEFVFSLGGLNFKSLMHENGTLVIAGARATYKGQGVMRDASGVQVNNLTYGFMVAAVDGQITGGATGKDRYRIKIWEVASGDIVYDNLLNADENADLSNPAYTSTELYEGSIVIHTPPSGKKSERDATEGDLLTNNNGEKFANYPNPFTYNNTTEFSFMQDTDYTVDVYDLRGSLVKRLQAGKAKAGTMIQAIWEPKESAKGVYIIRLVTQNGVQNMRVVRE